MKLTITKSKNLASKYLLDTKIKDGKFFYAHTKGVVKTVKLLAKKEKLKCEIFEIVAWVHDIGYSINKDKHAKYSLKILKKENFEVDKIMEDMILNHGNSGNPKTKQGKIIQIADKIAIIDKDFMQILLDNRISGEEIRFIKMLFDNCIKNLEKIK